MSSLRASVIRWLIFQDQDRKHPLLPEYIQPLLPLLPEYLFPKAFSVATRIYDQSLRASILDALLAGLSQGNCDTLLKQVLERQEEEEKVRVEKTWDLKARAIVALAPYMSPQLLREALRRARTIENPRFKVEALTALLPRLPEPIQQEVLQEAVESIEAEDLPWVQERLLIELAPHLSKMLLQEAIEIARMMRDAQGHVEILIELAPYLNEPLKSEIFQEALKGIRAIGSEGSRAEVQAEAMTRLLPYVPEQLQYKILKEAVQAAQAIVPTRIRLEGLIRLQHYIAERMIPQIRSRAQRIVSARNPKAALKQEISLQSQQLSQLTYTTVQTLNDDVTRTSLLVRLLPYLPEQEQEMAIQEAWGRAEQIADARKRLQLFAELHSYLPYRKRRRVIDYLSSFIQNEDSINASNVSLWVKVLPKIFPYLSKREKHKLVQRALVSAQTFQDVLMRTEILIALLPFLPWQLKHQIRQEVIENARLTENKQVRMALLVNLAPYLSANQSREILETVRTLEDAGIRMVLLARLLPCLTIPLKRQVYREILEVMARVEDELSLAEALVAIVPYLPKLLSCHLSEGISAIASGEVRDEEVLARLYPLIPRITGDKLVSTAKKIEDKRDCAEVLIRLAPFAQEETFHVVQMALDAAHTIEDVGNRAETLTALIGSLPEQLKGQVAREALETAQKIRYEKYRAKVLSALLPYLLEQEKQEVVRQVIQVVPEIRDVRERLEILTRLFPHLSEQEESAEIQRIVQDVQMLSDHQQAEVLALLLPLASEQEKSQLMQRVLHVAQSLKSGEDFTETQAVALALLLPHLPQPLKDEALQEVWKNVEASASYRYKVRLLVDLLPHFPERMKHEGVQMALEAVQNIEYHRDRAYEQVKMLMKLLSTVPEPMKLETLGEAQQTVKEIEYAHEYVAGLIELSAHLSGEEKQESLQRALETARETLEMTRSMTDYERDNIVTQLIPYKLLPHLNADVQSAVARETLEMTRSMTDRVKLVTQLIPYLSVQEALEAAHTLEYRAHRISLLVNLIASVQQETLKQEIVQKTLEVIRSISTQAEIFVFLNSILNSVQPRTEEVRPQLRPLLQEALEILRTKPEFWQANGVHFLCEFAPYLSEQQLERALERTLAIQDEKEQVKNLSELAPYLSEQQLERALEYIPQIENDAYHALIQAMLTFYLSNLQQGKVVERKKISIRDRYDFSTGVLQRILDLLVLIPEEERNALLEDMLDAMLLYPPFIGLAGGLGIQPPPAPQRVVNTGFAPVDQADQPLKPDSALTCNQTFYFWVEISPPLEEAIKDNDEKYLPELPKEARLKVALFAFTEGVGLTLGADTGELQLHDDGTVRVARRPYTPAGISEESDLLTRRLFFPVHIPEHPGIISLLCNIYYEQILIQSRLIRVNTLPDCDWPFRSKIVYTLAPTLKPADLKRMATHKLSVMLNSGTDATGNFCFLGTDGQELFKNEVPPDGQGVQNLIENTRSTLRRAAWGTDQDWQNDREWQKKYRYRYDDGVPRDLKFKRLREDLFNFAICGYRLYFKISGKEGDSGGLAGKGGRDMVEWLERLMREPGLIQIAMQRSPRFVPPMALIYDYPLDTNAHFDRYTLCPTFVESLKNNTPLEDLECFKGTCPTRDAMRRMPRSKQTVVCPSGFWGYRHDIGIPLSIEDGLDVPSEITYKESLHWLFSFSTDFHWWKDHKESMYKLWPKPQWDYADTRDKTLDLLETISPHLIYFYCHGGVSKDGVPYIQVGPQNEQGITPDNLPDITGWKDTRPLVFINGCHTTALEPEKAIEFVTPFIGRAAAGVIGTEITVFEPLARAFAEECLRHFLQGVPIGEAVRKARLFLLQRGNPLGLVYIPFVLPSLHLVDAKRGSVGDGITPSPVPEN